MSIRLRFNLLFVLTFCLAVVGSTLYYKKNVEQLTYEEIEREARLHMTSALAFRNYISSNVAPHFERLAPHELNRDLIPAFAVTQTMRSIYANYPGYSYREVALNPMNPTNMAEGWERRIIDRYRSGQLSGEQVEVTGSDEGRRFHVIRPLTITNADCLSCHGKPETAPALLKAKYGLEHGFGWKMGETVGAQIVSVPFNPALKLAEKAYSHLIFSVCLTFLTLFLFLNVLLSTLVLRPLRQANTALHKQSLTDPLTGVPNRRAFRESTATEMQVARARNSPFSVIMLDIDHFKKINDTYGHDMGDQVLKRVSSTAAKGLRKHDCLARLGGEEFAVILPGSTLDNATKVAETMRLNVEQEIYGAAGRVTASFGVAEWDGIESFDELLSRADKALYAAKRGGRNCVKNSDADFQI